MEILEDVTVKVLVKMTTMTEPHGMLTRNFKHLQMGKIEFLPLK